MRKLNTQESLMIDWKTIKDLHANKKLEEIIGKWFGVDIFYTDKHGNVHSNILNKDHEFLSHFFKLQMQLPHGGDLLSQDIENGLEKLNETEESSFYFDSFFPHVRMISAKIESEGDFLGAVFAYPYVTDKITSSEMSEIKEKLIECGSNEEDAQASCDNLKKLETHEYEYR